MPGPKVCAFTQSIVKFDDKDKAIELERLHKVFFFKGPKNSSHSLCQLSKMGV